MDYDTKVNLARRLEMAEALEKRIEALKSSMLKLKDLAKSGHAVTITITTAVPINDRTSNSLTMQLEASSSNQDCLTPAEVKDTINSLHHTLMAKYADVKTQYAAL